jgi:hypothetical protein
MAISAEAQFTVPPINALTADSADRLPDFIKGIAEHPNQYSA